MASSDLKAGQDALSRYAWTEARRCFEAALAGGPSAEGYEGLARAASWLEDEGGTFDGFERAYRLFKDGGDDRGAARAAMALAVASVEFRGEDAVANGWLQRAHGLIDHLDPVPEHGWLALHEGHYALMLRNDPAKAREHCARAIRVGREFGDVDLEMWATAIQGLALIATGVVDEGIGCLDAAASAVMSGEMRDLEAMSGALCYLMDACDRIRDYDRAAQWCGRIREFAAAHDVGLLYSVCRPHYAVVLIWRGAWDEAEDQLTASERELLETRPAMAVEAVVRLAELRWRQGRWDEAAALFGRVEHEPLSQLGRAELALDRGDAELAGDLAGQYLRRIPSENRFDRCAGLELVVRARVALGRAADDEADELRRIATDVGIAPLLGWAHMAAGLTAALREDDEPARRELEDAVFEFERAGAPFEASRARLALARVLRAMGRVPHAAATAQAALDSFGSLGAALERQRAQAFLSGLGAAVSDVAGSAAADNPAKLTERELDVVRLVAAGKSNQEIAKELVLSVRTVERHLSNVYGKLGTDGKAARAAATAYAFRNRHI